MKNGHFDQLHENLSVYVDIIEQLKQGNYPLDLAPPDPLGRALHDLIETLHTRQYELQRLNQITTYINEGLLLEDILNKVYAGFRELIPYNRIGCALIENDGTVVRAQWAQTDQPDLKIDKGYSALLTGSSLETIIQTGEPRILNDLENYLRHKPQSQSTRLIVEEGMRASLTCPLIAQGEPIGFIFFSSIHPYTYQETHVDIFQNIAQRLSVMVEKGRLVSELTAQKTAIEKQNEELRQLNELKNTFVGIAAHDLRSPLSITEMALSFLLDPEMGLSPDEQQTLITDSARQVHYMLELVEDLLDVSQIESGRLDLHPEIITPGDFLEETVRHHAALAASKGTTVQLEIPEPGEISADPRRLRQVMDNLISNAVKYSPAGSIVTIRCEPLSDVWRFSVTDQGPGIDPNDRARLFQDFARLSTKPTGGERSTGLGLAISRRVVEAHGGQIDVDSEPGHGATFWFTIPA
jgi:signal transduction histidine kinase